MKDLRCFHVVQPSDHLTWGPQNYVDNYFISPDAQEDILMLYHKFGMHDYFMIIYQILQSLTTPEQARKVNE